MIVAFGVAWRVNSAAAAVVNAPASHLAPAALDSLSRYLRPIALTSARRSSDPVELFVKEDFYAQPRDAAPRREDGASAPASARWVVTAIVLTDARRMAVVNDQVVEVGSTVSGARVVEIQSDRVVLQEAGGARRAISLNR